MQPQDFLSPNGPYDPALGLLFAQNPELAIRQFVEKGIRPSDLEKMNFFDRWKPTNDALTTGEFDPQGANSMTAEQPMFFAQPDNPFGAMRTEQEKRLPPAPSEDTSRAIRPSIMFTPKRYQTEYSPPTGPWPVPAAEMGGGNFLSSGAALTPPPALPPPQTIPPRPVFEGPLEAPDALPSSAKPAIGKRPVQEDWLSAASKSLAAVQAPKAPSLQTLHPYLPRGGEIPQKSPILEQLMLALSGSTPAPASLRLGQALWSPGGRR